METVMWAGNLVSLLLNLVVVVKSGLCFEDWESLNDWEKLEKGDF